MRRFIGGDFGDLLQDVAEFVDALHQAVLGEGIHRESHHTPGGRSQCLIRQIDLHSGAGPGGGSAPFPTCTSFGPVTYNLQYTSNFGDGNADTQIIKQGDFGETLDGL